MIRFAEKSDFDALKQLWHICFNDDYEYIDNFFEHRFEKACVYEVDNKIVSALHLLECECIFNKTAYSALYIYAACTLPEYRGKGYMGELIDYVKCNSACDYIVLVPAEKSLFDYYKRFGFKTAFKSKIAVVSNQTAFSDAVPRKASVDEIFEIREKYLNGCDYLKWSKNAVEYAVNECSVALTCDDAYIIGYETDNEINIIEAIGENQALSALLASQTKKGKGCKVSLLYSSALFDENITQTVDKAMILPLNSNAENALNKIVPTAYFGLTLE